MTQSNVKFDISLDTTRDDTTKGSKDSDGKKRPGIRVYIMRSYRHLASNVFTRNQLVCPQKSRKKTRVEVISPIPENRIFLVLIKVHRRLKNVFRFRQNIHCDTSLH